MDLKKVETIKPFTRFLMTIGELPSSYLVSMTYEEQLLWFCNFLQNTVIPTVNNNAEAVIELQEFVSNYFENLDVQEEINNKLDEMAESGELTEIIAEYLSLAALFCYDTIADMAASENLDNGSSVYCLGKDTYNDGKGAFYKIREITSGDTVDGYNIVAITNNVTVVGERLPNYEINTINSTLETLTETTIPGIQDDITTINETTIPGIQDEIDGITETTIPAIQSDITTINNTTIPGVESEINAETANRIIDGQTITSLVTISDSYGVMDGTTNWCTYIKSYLNLDNDHFYNNSYGGTGFARSNDDKTFTTLVNECAVSLSADRRNAVSHVIIAGGYNDQWSSEGDIKSGVATCVTAAHTVFPNAKIFVAHIGWSTNTSDLYHTFRSYYEGTSLTKYGKFIINSQNILRADLISIDNIHPTNEGLQTLASNLITGLQTGSCYPLSGYVYLKDSNNNNMGTIYQNNDIFVFELYEDTYSYTGTANGQWINYKTLAGDSMISGHNCKFSVPCMFAGNNSYVMGTCLFIINGRDVKLAPTATTADGTNYMSFTEIRFSNTTAIIPHTMS